LLKYSVLQVKKLLTPYWTKQFPHGKMNCQSIFITGAGMSQSGNSSKRQMRREQIRRKETRGRNIFTAVIVIIALLIGGLIVWSQLKPIAKVTKIDANPREQADANHMGDPNAPVQLTEFADFQCPFCERFYSDTEGQLEETYINTGQLYFTYRSAGNWVSQNMQQGKTESEDAAQAAYCAGDQNMFWEMHDMLYENAIGEDAGSFTDRRLKLIAEETGLDMDQFDECYSSGKYADQVELDFKEGVQSGMNGTPTFILTYTNAAGEQVPFPYTDGNGQPQLGVISGAQPFSFFQQQIDAALAMAGK
jgi:protein-disulfide isomerase